MTKLPHFNPVEPSSDRLWKRVRHIESNLGYSNLVHTRLNNAHGARNRQWQDDILDPPSHHRKRRMPRVGASSRVQGSAPQRDLLKMNSRSVPALSLPSEEHSTPPWTQPISQHDVGRGGLPRLPDPPQESETNRALEGAQESSMPGAFGAAETVGDRRHSEARQTPLSSDNGPGGGLSPGRQSKANHVNFPVQAQALVERDFADDREVDSGGKVMTPPCEVEEVAEVAEGAVGAALDAKACDSPSDLDIAPKAVEGQQQRRFVVRTLPSGKKLRAVRAGRCRSLVSPNNKVFSSTVVARVKQGLQNGDNEQRPKVLIVGSGTFNPIHKIHIRRFYLARNFLQVQKGMRVVGGILSPSHPTLVRQRHRVRAAEIIPPKHRLSMARAAVGEGSWLAVDPWEVTRKRIMDYMSVLEHAKEVCHETFPGHAGDITILYMCQASQIHHLNPAMLRAGGFGVITVCRPLEKASLLKELSPSFRNIAILVEDSTILSAEMERTSSNMVRHLLKQGKSVEGMVGKAVARYIRDNTIAQRVSGREKWTVEDNNFMFDQEDKEDRPYHNLPRLYMRRASQMPLQM